MEAIETDYTEVKHKYFIAVRVLLYADIMIDPSVSMILL